MKIVRFEGGLANEAKSLAWLRRRGGITAFVALTALLCSGSTAPTSCQGNTGSVGPSAGEVIGAAVGVGGVIATVTFVAVEHSRHTLKGCIFAGSNGLLLKTSQSTVYAIEGDVKSIKAGEKVRFHGSRVKKTKDTSGNQVFLVQEVRKDYGPCQANLAQSSRAGLARQADLTPTSLLTR